MGCMVKVVVVYETGGMFSINRPCSVKLNLSLIHNTMQHMRVTDATVETKSIPTYTGTLHPCIAYVASYCEPTFRMNTHTAAYHCLFYTQLQPQQPLEYLSPLL